MTGNDLIRRALLLAGIIGETDTPTAEQAVDTFSALNVMLSAWAVEGFLLYQYTNPTDDIGLESGYERAVKFNLAVEISAEYGREPPPTVMRIATASKRLLRRNTAAPATSSLDGLLYSSRCGSGGYYNVFDDSYLP